MGEVNYCIYCLGRTGGEDICPHCGKDRKEYRTEPHHLAPYTILSGRYLIGIALGEGGFGITYIARDLNLDMIVAVKEYYPFGYVNRNHTYSDAVSVSGMLPRGEYEKGIAKLMEEARTLAKLSGMKGIVGVRDFFLYNNTAYIVMDYLKGCTLKDYLKMNGKLSFEQTVRILNPIAGALAEVHKTGLIHRDISPDNIMIMKNGDAELLDFGAARDVSGDDSRSLSVILKHGYAPEEQYRSRGKQGPWTDVYALAAVVYRCITGRTPDEALERGHIDMLKKPSELGTELPESGEQALMKGLAVFQEDRYQNVEVFWKALTEKKEAEPRKESRTEDQKTETDAKSRNIAENKEDDWDDWFKRFSQAGDNKKKTEEETGALHNWETEDDEKAEEEYKRQIEEEKEKRKKTIIVLLVLLVIIGFFVGLGITGGKTEKKEQREPEEGQSTERNIIQEIPHYVLYCEGAAIEFPVTLHNIIEQSDWSGTYGNLTGLWIDNGNNAIFFFPYWDRDEKMPEFSDNEELAYIEENMERYNDRTIFDIKSSGRSSLNILLTDGSGVVLGETTKENVRNMLQGEELVEEDTAENALFYKIDNYLYYAFYFDEGDCAYRLDVYWEYDGCAIVPDERLYIRKEPSTASPGLFTAMKDETLKIWGETDGTDGHLWYLVSNEAGTKGYVRSDQVILTE